MLLPNLTVKNIQDTAPGELVRYEMRDEFVTALIAKHPENARRYAFIISPTKHSEFIFAHEIGFSRNVLSYGTERILHLSQDPSFIDTELERLYRKAGTIFYCDSGAYLTASYMGSGEYLSGAVYMNLETGEFKESIATNLGCIFGKWKIYLSKPDRSPLPFECLADFTYEKK